MGCSVRARDFDMEGYEGEEWERRSDKCCKAYLYSSRTGCEHKRVLKAHETEETEPKMNSNTPRSKTPRRHEMR